MTAGATPWAPIPAPLPPAAHEAERRRARQILERMREAGAPPARPHGPSPLAVIRALTDQSGWATPDSSAPEPWGAAPEISANWVVGKRPRLLEWLQHGPAREDRSAWAAWAQELRDCSVHIFAETAALERAPLRPLREWLDAWRGEDAGWTDLDDALQEGPLATEPALRARLWPPQRWRARWQAWWATPRDAHAWATDLQTLAAQRARRPGLLGPLLATLPAVLPPEAMTPASAAVWGDLLTAVRTPSLAPHEHEEACRALARQWHAVDPATFHAQIAQELAPWPPRTEQDGHRALRLLGRIAAVAGHGDNPAWQPLGATLLAWEAHLRAPSPSASASPTMSRGSRLRQHREVTHLLLLSTWGTDIAAWQLQLANRLVPTLRKEDRGFAERFLDLGLQPSVARQIATDGTAVIQRILVRKHPECLTDPIVRAALVQTRQLPIWDAIYAHPATTADERGQLMAWALELQHGSRMAKWFADHPHLPLRVPRSVIRRLLLTARPERRELGLRLAGTAQIHEDEAMQPPPPRPKKTSR